MSDVQNNQTTPSDDGSVAITKEISCLSFKEKLSEAIQIAQVSVVRNHQLEACLFECMGIRFHESMKRVWASSTCPGAWESYETASTTQQLQKAQDMPSLRSGALPSGSYEVKLDTIELAVDWYFHVLVDVLEKRVENASRTQMFGVVIHVELGRRTEVRLECMKNEELTGIKRVAGVKEISGRRRFEAPDTAPSKRISGGINKMSPSRETYCATYLPRMRQRPYSCRFVGRKGNKEDGDMMMEGKNAEKFGLKYRFVSSRAASGGSEVAYSLKNRIEVDETRNEVVATLSGVLTALFARCAFEGREKRLKGEKSYWHILHGWGDGGSG
ncbi:hypothetical protein B0H19DRAFT_1062874 [Mycena capillaripes]|nr:hypothetical protein B0H19DRAFT_1062874 [Mycena capillaripes]